tara:strand:- start:6447 stop:7139 length:693 start_codon:yes stop_codon:yes gene_type:complete
MPEGLTKGIAGIPLGFSTGGIYQDPTPLVTNQAAQFSPEDVNSPNVPLEPVSKTSFNLANAAFTGAGLLVPALAPLSFGFTLARAYNYLFGEDEAQTQNMEPFGIDPIGQFTGIGGPTGSDDTSDDPEDSDAAATASAAAVGFDTEDTEMAAEMSTDDTGGGSGPSGGGSDTGDAPGGPFHLGGFVDTGSQMGGIASLRPGANALQDYVRSKLDLSNGIGGYGPVLGNFG